MSEAETPVHEDSNLALRSAQRLVDRLVEHDADGMADLYAHDGVFGPPARFGVPPIRGREAIRRYYFQRVSHHDQQIVARFVANDREAVAILESTGPTGEVSRFVDIMTVDATGAITENLVYER
jgi:hypothetical protein